MANVLLTGWKPGLRKVSLTRLLQQYTQLSLVDAKGNVDRLLTGAAVTITLISDDVVNEFVEQAIAIGVNVNLPDEHHLAD